jgi:predicted nucleic acid-binding protein
VGAIVLDTNAVVRAILSPAGARRKLWLLLVYGGVVHRAKQIGEELQLVRESGLQIDGGAELVLRRAKASAEEITPAFEANEVPRYTEGRDRDDDIVIHTALVGSARVLISNDMRDVSLDRDGETEYSDDQGNVVRAMTFEHFATTHLDLDLDTVDGARLAEAYDIDGSG